MGNKKIGVLVVCVLLLLQINFILAVKPDKIVNINGLQLFTPQVNAVKQNTDFKAHIHVVNITNGLNLPNDEVSCYGHLYNSTGHHTMQVNIEKDSNGLEHELLIDKGNFSINGDYTSYIWCNDSTSGGEVKGFFMVTPNGKEEPSGIVIVFYSLLFLIIISSLIGMVIFNIGKFAEKEYNLWYLIANVSGYILLFGFFILSKQYLGNQFIDENMIFILAGTAFTNIVLPGVIFVISQTMWKWQEAEQW